jgi:Spermidine synthase
MLFYADFKLKKPAHYLPPLLFCVTLFTSAGLLFWIQPLIAKTLLPLLGGSPSVWNTCLLFFQTTLLLGYVYGLVLSKWPNLRAQATVHIFLLALIAIYLFRSPAHAPVLTAADQANPTIWLLRTLLFSIGLPFFILSATNPLLQSWFSKLRHHLAVDPYFLYAASNAGSLIALVAFPLALEPSFVLNQQYRLWRVGFAVLVGLTSVIALSFTFRAVDSKDASGVRELDSLDSKVTLSVFRRARWLALSFVPSSLMIGVTTYITADVAAVPLLWVIPLALYLLTFIFAFTRKQFVRTTALNRMMIMGALVVTLILASGATEPAWVLIIANLGFFFVAALMCHGQLANDRPSVAHLAEYYLWIAIGGALGSLFTVLIAPLLFTSIVEYPLAIVLACMLQRVRSEETENRQSNYLDFIYPVALYALTVGLAISVNQLRPGSSIVRVFIVLGIPLIIINHFLRQRPMRFALGLAAVMLASLFYTGGTDRTLHVVRNFFGTTRVTTDSKGAINSLYSGNTVHGRQFVDPSRRCEPLSYHHENGPLGQVMAVFNAAPANPRVAVIGLGVGATVAYSAPAQEWTFYEIDPDVINLARNSQYFTYLQNCANGSLTVIEGDARLNLQNAQDGKLLRINCLGRF